MKHIQHRLEEFIGPWDQLYPHNPVQSQDDDEDSEGEREGKTRS